jgi:2-amino-4-hydroxy-6-hydroxymethyldihydropteridine diphosphokinase
MNPDRLVVIALGSNLGESAEILHSACDQLRSLTAGFFATSSLWRSVPVDCPPGSPDFLNAVAAFETKPGLEAQTLLRQMQAWERDFGRQPKTVLNEARPLDLDLIAFGQLQIQTEELILPHPRAHLRSFVLKPLAEILPEFRLPGIATPVRELALGCVGDCFRLPG